MKGGLTSGIVYPATVLHLASEFQFHCVGGTSAGAIAAALTAAAEAGRAGGGFTKLEKIAAELAEPGFLLRVFRAGEGTRSLMALFVSLLARRPKKPGKVGKAWFFGPALYFRLSYYMPFAFVLGALTGAVLFAGVAYAVAWLGHAVGNQWHDLPRTPLANSATLWGAVIVAAIAGSIIGGFAGAVARILYLLFCYLPKNNFFGICTGFIPGDSQVLTGWLHKQINDLFGRSETEPAVTFADLAAKDVQLKVISTNLAQNRPYIFPREPEGFHLVFNEDELNRLFPQSVMAVLRRTPAEGWRGPKLPRGYCYLPERDELPVVVATRMSLSFPVLISAVPLYSVKPAAYGKWGKKAKEEGKPEEEMQFDEDDLQRHWFSDGGICSNFPVGLFDVWLPKRPTFGINLNYLKSGQKRDSKVPAANVPGADTDTDADVATDNEAGMKSDVYLPPVRDKGRPQWNAIDGLPMFLGSIFNTAQNYRDTLQSMLPSYRERIAQVWLDPEEGGMNLTMAPEKIRSLSDKGKLAGELLAGMDFDAHRCMRLRVLLKVLCKEVKSLHELYPTTSEYQNVAAAPGTWCENNDYWKTIQPYIDALVTFSTAWTAMNKCSKVFDGKPPTFEGDLHIHPKI